MGHLGRLKQEYRELVDRLDQGPVGLPEPADPRAWEGFREILEILFTPEEAELASRLPVRPASLAALARRLAVPEDQLAARLEPMCQRGVVMDLVNPRTGRAVYLLAPPVVGFFEFSMMRAHDGIPKKRMAEALHAYTRGDPAFAREALAGDTKLGRALVHETALADGPLPDVLPWERATEVIGKARRLAVSHCFCRHAAEHLGTKCDAPVEVCLSVNGGAEFVVRRGFGREIDRAEGLDVLARARGLGLVQLADNVQSRPAWVCNCCGCCCEQLRGVSEFGLAAVNPSGFAPTRRAEVCAGCSRCARACPVGAVEMRPVRAEGSRRNGLAPAFDLDRCIGCGVCAGACHKGALSMARSGGPPRVPASAIEKAVRMALERGRLAHLLVDGGAGFGSRFLQRALDALLALPPARRALATEQVRSRFVRAALSRLGGLS
ncbi:MAG TPA: 4Fe-4S dicluster domain-containing protein [Anaeromyxobacteraceae bacterium]|nr:4Fe-4S dicluster domain-containing protein [Anaeromyxobacteraceae bacterium]